MEYWQSFSRNSRCRPIQEHINPPLLLLHLLHVSAIWRTNFSRFSFYFLFFFFLDIYSIFLYVPPNSQTRLPAHSPTEDNFLQFPDPISKTFSAKLLFFQASPRFRLSRYIQTAHVSCLCTDFLFVLSRFLKRSFLHNNTSENIFLPIYLQFMRNGHKLKCNVAFLFSFYYSNQNYCDK